MDAFTFEFVRSGWRRVRSMIVAPKRVAELEKRIAELEGRPPSVQINLAPGSTYNDFRGTSGTFHVNLDGRAEVIARTPITVHKDVRFTASSGSPTVTARVRAVKPDDSDQDGDQG